MSLKSGLNNRMKNDRSVAVVPASMQNMVSHLRSGGGGSVSRTTAMNKHKPAAYRKVKQHNEAMNAKLSSRQQAPPPNDGRTKHGGARSTTSLISSTKRTNYDGSTSSDRQPEQYGDLLKQVVEDTNNKTQAPDRRTGRNAHPDNQATPDAGRDPVIGVDPAMLGNAPIPRRHDDGRAKDDTTQQQQQQQQRRITHPEYHRSSAISCLTSWDDGTTVGNNNENENPGRPSNARDDRLRKAAEYRSMLQAQIEENNQRKNTIGRTSETTPGPHHRGTQQHDRSLHTKPKRSSHAGVVALLDRGGNIDHTVNNHAQPPPVVVTVVDSTKEEMEYYQRQERSHDEGGWCEISVAGDASPPDLGNCDEHENTNVGGGLDNFDELSVLYSNVVQERDSLREALANHTNRRSESHRPAQRQHRRKSTTGVVASRQRHRHPA